MMFLLEVLLIVDINCLNIANQTIIGNVKLSISSVSIFYQSDRFPLHIVNHAGSYL